MSALLAGSRLSLGLVCGTFVGQKYTITFHAQPEARGMKRTLTHQRPSHALSFVPAAKSILKPGRVTQMAVLCCLLTIAVAALNSVAAAPATIVSEPVVQSSPALPLNITAGNATLTHYDLPLDYVASCGCVGRSTHYPTAALNALAYGSTNSFGPACGTCYRLRLQSTPRSPPPPDGDGISFTPEDGRAPTIVVKIIDQCPIGGPWCSQTQQPNLSPVSNELGSMIHFDLAWPSAAIPSTFFPLDSTHSDYGVWWTQYELADCIYWAGYEDAASWGSDWQQQDAACCPARPTTSDIEGESTDDRTTAGLPPSLDRHAQTAICPSYDALQFNRSLAIPNTTNILSRQRRSGTHANTATSDHAFVRPLQTLLRNVFAFPALPHRQFLVFSPIGQMVNETDL